MESEVCVLTKRGQVSLPAALRRNLGLRTGQKLRWERVSDRELRVTVESPAVADPVQALGFGPKVRGTAARRTDEWMREMREGEGEA